MLVPAGQYRYEVLQAAAVATGNGTAISPTSPTGGSYTLLTMQVKGITTVTITWEATIDGTNWVAVPVKNIATGTEATTTTADGLYRVLVAGFISFRARVSAWTTGATTVTGVMTA